MSFRAADRAQSIQIGAVLLLGALVLSFSLYQAVVVPDQNREVEFNHNQRVQGDLQDLRNAIVSTEGGGSGQSVSVTLGTQYPSRVVALNPGTPSGSLRSLWTANMSQNATVGNAEAVGETGDFWTGVNRSYNTGGLVYRPGYNEYTQAPVTRFEQSVLYNQFPGSTLTLTGQRLISDDRISLVTLNGSYDTTRSGSASVDVRPISASANTVTVTNATPGENVTLRFATQLTADQWRDILASEFVSPDGSGGNVVAVDPTEVPGEEYRIVSVVLRRGVDYDLRITQAGVGTGTDRPDVAYLTDTDGAGTTVPEGGTATVTVEVRDALNNPVGQQFVYAGTNRSASGVSPDRSRSDSAGEVTFTYEAPTDISDAAQRTDLLNASLVVPSNATDAPTFDNTTAMNVTVPVTVENTDGSGLSSPTNGSDGAYAVDWLDPSGQSGVECPSGPDGTCTVFTNETSSVALTADTDPTATNATMEFAVSNATVGTVSPSSNATADNGNASTTFSPTNPGQTTVYAASGGSGDRLSIDVVDGTSDTSNTAPTASFTASSTTVATGETIDFDASGSSDSDGSIASYEWDWTDDGTFEATSQTPSHSYPNDGTYTVVLRVTDDDGATDEATETITVTNRAPTASFTASCASLTCDFDGLGSSDPDGSIASYSWQFGDGNSGNGETTSHTYDGGGTYDVTLTVTDDDSASNSTTQSVSISDTNPPSVASAAFNDTDDVINDSEANANVKRSLTLTFNESMDTGVAPTIEYENLTQSNNYSVLSGSSGWVDATTYVQVIEFQDNDADVTTTAVVSGAEDEAGNVMNTERTVSFVVDTNVPSTPNNAFIVPDAINASNENGITVGIREPDTIAGDETAVINVTNATTGDEIVVAKVVTDANGRYTNITGVDVSGLPDGTVEVDAYLRDDVGQTSDRTGLSDPTLKDTIVPTISDFRAEQPSETTVRAIFTASERLASARVDVVYQNGTVVNTFTRSNNISENEVTGGYEYTTGTYTMGDLGEYELTLTFANDSADNRAAVGQTDTVVNGTSAAFVRNVSGSGATSGGRDQIASFALENTGPVDVTIQNITVVSTQSGQPDQIGNGSRGGGNSYTDDGGPEFYSNRTASLLDTNTPFAIGPTDTEPLDTPSTLSAGQRTRYTVGEFRQSNNQERSPGSSVTVRLGFDDGTETEITIPL
ncbi:PKD domain-containing protein [Halapricum sp. CBA1109]|uniref:PKD domain-containing protein n=1 Tax=Halapricum sp. CBA1109 TaxID=2668068 RepID=UPI0012FBF344|nr:PKD domain-containing protein [Halapricum sp. CBA1109]MUV90306.1 PKD domain-containing protein [Halapricum sp. CBA1109]